MALRIRRGTEAQRVGQTFDLGEIVYITDSYKLYVGDGVTLGGKNIAENLAGDGLIFDEITGTLQWAGVTYTTDDIEEGSNNKYFSNQLAQDAVGQLLTNGAGDNVGITFTYDDVDHKLFAEVALDGVGLLNVVEDTTPQLGGNLDLNSHDITGTGNVSITGTIVATSFKGDVKASDNSTLLNNTSKALTVNTIALNTGYGTITGDSMIVSTGTNAFLNSTYNASTPWITYLQSQGANASVTPITFARSRGTTGSPTTIQTNDQIVNLSAAAYTGGAYTAAGAIACIANGTISPGVAPSAWVIRAADSAGTLNTSLAVGGEGIVAYKQFLFTDGTASAPSIGFTTDGSQDTGFFHPGDGILCISTDATERVRVDNGGMRVVGFMKVGGFATGSLPSPAEAGMIVLDTTTGEFKGYNGTSWVVLG